MKKFTILSLALSLALSGVAVAGQSTDVNANGAKAGNTLLATQGISKSSAGSVALDVQTDGMVTAMSFLVRLPKGVQGLDIDNCLSKLPSTHTGKCRASKDGSKVAVVLYSPSNTPLPEGLVSLGEINYSSGAKGSVSIEKVTMAGASGHDSRAVDVQVAPVDIDVKKPRKEIF